MSDDDGHAISYKVLRRGTPVRSAAERAVTTTFAAAEAPQHLADRGSSLGRALGSAKTVRRAKRWGRGMRERWDRR